MRISNRMLGISEEPFTIALNLPPGIIRLSGGEPDYPTADFVNAAGFRAASEGKTHYSPAAGIVELRKMISKKLKEDNGLSYDSQEIVVTPGTSSAVTLLLFAIIDPGDEVLLTDPAWFHYATLIELAGGTPKRIQLDQHDGFLLSSTKIEQILSSRTKAMILNSPSNPTGRVFSRAELEGVSSVAERHDLAVISDEIYEKIVYPPNSHISIASLSGMRERVVTVNGFSKGYAMMGWRLGYAAAPREIARKLESLLGYSMVCANTVSQYAAIEALSNPESQTYRNEMLDSWTRRRSIVMRYVARNEDIIAAQPPQGTFYGWIDVSPSGMTGDQAARLILQEAKVGVMPGYLFGDAGRNFIRISFATSDSSVDEGLKRLCLALRDAKAKSTR